MSGRLNLVANTLTDFTTSVVTTGGAVAVAGIEKGGSAAVGMFTVVDNVMKLGVIATDGWVADADSLEDIRRDERAYNRLERADALALKVAQREAAKASAS